MARPPFAIEDLPDSLHQIMREAVAKEVYEEALAALRATKDPTPETLVAEAYCLFEDACTVMVDEVLASGQKALEILDEARSRGVPASQLRTYRARINRALRAERAREAQVMTLLERSTNSLAVEEVTDLAYLLDEKGGSANSVRASKLWKIAERLAPSSGKTRPGYYRARLGLSLWDAGLVGEAKPYLDELVSRGVEIGDGLEDSFAHLAANRYMEAALAGGLPDRINETFAELVALLPDFPVARPVRRSLEEAIGVYGKALDPIREALLGGSA